MCNIYLQCEACNLEIASGSLTVFSDLRRNATWHPDCFRCDECKELLAELVHCYDYDNLYCVRHYGELDYHRCEDCDQVSTCILSRCLWYYKCLCTSL